MKNVSPHSLRNMLQLRFIHCIGLGLHLLISIIIIFIVTADRTGNTYYLIHHLPCDFLPVMLKFVLDSKTCNSIFMHEWKMPLSH